jgi:hypothetical protein
MSATSARTLRHAIAKQVAETDPHSPDDVINVLTEYFTQNIESCDFEDEMRASERAEQ